MTESGVQLDSNALNHIYSLHKQYNEFIINNDDCNNDLMQSSITLLNNLLQQYGIEIPVYNNNKQHIDVNNDNDNIEIIDITNQQHGQQDKKEVQQEEVKQQHINIIDNIVDDIQQLAKQQQQNNNDSNQKQTEINSSNDRSDTKLQPIYDINRDNNMYIESDNDNQQQHNNNNNDDFGEWQQVHTITLQRDINAVNQQPTRKRGRQPSNQSYISTTEESYVIQTSNGHWKCDQCNKESSTKNELLTHIRAAHTKTKPYQCRYCSKSFTDSSGRSKHEKSHNKISYFKCDSCGLTFKLAVLLKKHKRDMHSHVQNNAISDIEED